MFSYFKNRKTTYFDVFCLNFSIETKIKTIFQISYFNLSKKTRNDTLGTRIISVPKVLFHFFDKLKNEIQNSLLRFCFYFDKENEIQITDNRCTESAIQFSV